MTDRLSELLERAHTDLGAPALPSVAAVKRRGDTLRLRRRVAAGVAGALTVGSVVTAAALLRPTGLATDLPATRPSAAAPSAPSTRSAGRSPDGLLLPADLNPAHPWQREAGGQGDQDTIEIGMPACGTTLGDSVGLTTAAGRAGTYRGRMAEGPGWAASERVATLDPGMAAELAAQLESLAACTANQPSRVIASAEHLVVIGASTSGAEVTEGYYVSGTTMISIVALLKGPEDSRLGLARQAEWMGELLVTAVERATGERPGIPTPNASAITAAVTPVTPEAGGPVASIIPAEEPAPPTPDLPDMPPTLPSDVPDTPQGFLSLSDVGSLGRLVGVDSALSQFGPAGPVTSLPSCGGTKPPALIGRTALVDYLVGHIPVPDHGVERLAESVTLLDPESTARARSAFRTLAACATISHEEGSDRLHPDEAVVVFSAGNPIDTLPGGATLWALSGNHLVQLSARSGDQRLSAQQISTLMTVGRTALRRAADLSR